MGHTPDCSIYDESAHEKTCPYFDSEVAFLTPSEMRAATAKRIYATSYADGDSHTPPPAPLATCPSCAARFDRETPALMRTARRQLEHAFTAERFNPEDFHAAITEALQAIGRERLAERARLTTTTAEQLRLNGVCEACQQEERNQE